MDNKPSNGLYAEKIAVLLPSLEGGGAERSMLNLIKAFLLRGRKVDLLLCQAKGAYLDDIPAAANMIELTTTGGLQTRWIVASTNLRDLVALLRPVLLSPKIAPEIARIDSLCQYIQQHQPDVILSAMTYSNLVAIWAKQAASINVPVVVSERIALSTYCASPRNFRKWRWRYLPALVHRTYPRADAVVTVSHQVADDLVENVGLDPRLTMPIYNPVVDEALRARAEQPLDHAWFAADSPPVILGAGRLTEQKDFASLMRAFAIIRANREARLVILGEGRLRDNLKQLSYELGIQDDVDMPGFVNNPFQYMARAAAFALSSEYEGLPGVLIQALACGCPVVSTDCPGGSAEILADGEFGALVPVGDSDAMAEAVLAELDNPTHRDVMLQRAEDFSVERAASNYLKLLDETVKQSHPKQ